mmetsp:Transcript_643/g.1682  ORF Transcript_643/g.1682 Transcript_643/m.1682 type:complete len:244 (+) Transcript_643:671-1402(+)
MRHVLQFPHSKRRIQIFRARLGAITYGVTVVQLRRALEHAESRLLVNVARIRNPTERLHEHRRPEVAIRIPPVARTARLTTRAQYAFIHAIKARAVFYRLQVLLFALLLQRALTLNQPRANRFVLRVKIGHVGNQILDDVHVRQWIDVHFSGDVINGLQARKRVLAIDIHRTGSANSFATRAPKRKRRVLLVLDLDQRVQHHRPRLVQIQVILSQLWFVPAFRVPAIDHKSLLSSRCHSWGRH